MNNFEKRKFLDYLEKLLPVTSLDAYSFDDVFDFFCCEFKVNKSNYPIDSDNCLDVDNSKKRENFTKILKKDIARLKEKITPKNTVLEKQLLTIRDIYNLNHEEYEIMVYLTLKEVNNIFRMYFDCLEHSSFTTFARIYLGLRQGKKDRIMDKKYYRPKKGRGYKYGFVKDFR